MPEKTPKNIVVCSDGTGNSGFKNRGTNVYKLFEAVDVHGGPGKPRQFKVYDDGVGTRRFKPLKMLGLALGIGLRENVFQLYEAIVRAYEEDDQIYMFGFSRGAFTVRVLADFIAECGIPKEREDRQSGNLRDHTKAAWRAYRRQYAARLQKPVLRLWRILMAEESRSHKEELRVFKKDHPSVGVRIRFLGVWDTVDAYGVPFDTLAWAINTFIFRYRFCSHRLNGIVDYGRHALAIDDERKTFHPTMWDEIEDSDDRPLRGDEDGKHRVRQVWFPGMHSDVGGGYSKHGLSLLALRWMIDELNWVAKRGKTFSETSSAARALQKSGLRLVAEDCASFHAHSNSDGCMHNSRSGLAAFYRYCPRDIAKLCDDVKLDGRVKAEVRIHDSAARRISSSTQGYAPRGIPMSFEKEVSGKQSAGGINLDLGTGTDRSAYQECAEFIRCRRRVQRALYFVSVVIACYAVKIRAGSLGELVTMGGMLKTLGSIWTLYPSLPVAFVLIASFSLLFRLVIGRKCQAFWQAHRHRL